MEDNIFNSKIDSLEKHEHISGDRWWVPKPMTSNTNVRTKNKEARRYSHLQ
jgi:hypothetical protein